MRYQPNDRQNNTGDPECQRSCQTQVSDPHSTAHTPDQSFQTYGSSYGGFGSLRSVMVQSLIMSACCNSLLISIHPYNICK